MGWVTIHTRSGKIVHVNIPDAEVDRTIKQRATKAALSDVKAVASGKQERAAALARARHASKSQTTFAGHYRATVERKADTGTRRGRGLLKASQGHFEAERAQVQGRANDLVKTMATARDKAQRDAATKAAARLAMRQNASGEVARKVIPQYIDDWRADKAAGLGKQARVPILGRALAKIRARLTRG